jgi:acyl-CoA thioesterase YciA
MIDPKTQRPVLIQRPGPNESNARGDIFGGWLMSQVDVACSITAGETTKGMTVTRAIKDFEFLKSIFTYDIVNFYTEVIDIGKTSITINCEVYAQRTNKLAQPVMDEMIKVSSSTLVFVAVHEPGKTRVIER